MRLLRHKKNSIWETGAKRVLSVIDCFATRNARAMCKGLLYEPKVPKKLRDTDYGIQD